MELDNLTTVLNSTLENYLMLDRDDVEVELRIGRIIKNGEKRKYSTDVGKDKFDLILEKAKETIGSPKEMNIRELKSKGGRFRFDENNNVIEAVQKKKLRVTDFDVKDGYLDVRIGISTEKTIEYDPTMKGLEILKYRTSFLSTYSRLELTVVNIPSKPDISTSYQVEIEADLKKLDISNVGNAVSEIIERIEWVLKMTAEQGQM